MATFELEEWIARSPEQIFQFVTNPKNAPRISPSIQSLEPTSPGPLAKGTRYRETRLMNGKPAQAELEVVEYDPPRAYAMRNVTEGIETTYRYTLMPTNKGTQVKLLAKVSAGGLKKLMEPVVAGILKKEDGDQLVRLKTVLESE